MLMWIDSGGGQLPNGFEEKLKEQNVTRDDRHDYVWINLDTGAVLSLIDVGGWRTAHTSGYKVFLSSPGGLGPLIDVTFGLIGASFAKFDATQTGSETYSSAFDESRSKISERLGARQLYDEED